MADAATRKAILEYLHRRPFASSQELARELGITLSGVRYHLSRLAREGLVEDANPPLDQKLDRGRPPRTVRLTEQNRLHNLDRLTRALARLALEPQPAMPGKIEVRLAELLAGEPAPGTSLPKRLANAILLLNRQQYSSSWEARSSGPRITFGNCPYAAVWHDLPVLCQMDRLMLERLLGAEVELVQTMFPAGSTEGTCIFQMHLSGTARK